jgi:hypothetical protein
MPKGYAVNAKKNGRRPWLYPFHPAWLEVYGNMKFNLPRHAIARILRVSNYIANVFLVGSCALLSVPAITNRVLKSNVATTMKTYRFAI